MTRALMAFVLEPFEGSFLKTAEEQNRPIFAIL